MAASGSGGGGTEVVANPTLAGTEPDLTGLQVGDDKYKVPDPGTTVVANPTLAGTESDLVGLQVGDTKYKISAGGVAAPKLVAPLAELMDPTTIDTTPGSSCIIFNQCTAKQDHNSIMYWWGWVPTQYTDLISEYTFEDPLAVNFVICPTVADFSYINLNIANQEISLAELTDPHCIQLLFYWDEDNQRVEGFANGTYQFTCSPFDLYTMTIFVSVDEEGGSGSIPTIKQDCLNAILSAEDCVTLFNKFTFE